MNQHLPAAVDLIEELRLRRWARLNYVPEEGRAADLHPIVLDEMQLREDELLDASQRAQSAGIVPLYEPPHRELYGPHFQATVQDRTESGPQELHYY